MEKSCQIVVKKVVKSCQKVVKKLSKNSLQKVVKKFVQILKRVGEEEKGGEEGDLYLLDQVRPCRTW
jgi:hypothetical protein